MAMEDSSMMSPADIAALTRGNTGFGGGDGISWLVLILLFFGFMGGGWGGRYSNGELGKYATAASQQDILFGQHFGQINDRLTNIGNGICSLGYDMQGNIAGLGKEVALGQANLQLQASNNAASLASQLSQCCCTTQRGIDSVNYNGAINTAAINKNIDDKFAALEKAGLERRIQEQAAKISALELASQMAGVVKYPMSYAYSAGQSPFCGCSGCYAPSV